jgi:hypothetical protein
MSGEIVTTTEVGIHNADLPKSAGRILEGGSWKKQRVVMLIPTAQHIPARVVLSWINLIFPPNQGALRLPMPDEELNQQSRYNVMMLGMEVGHAYSEAIGQILAHPDFGQWEYILTVEHDNAGPPDAVLKLIQRMEQHPEFACIGGLYWTKGEGGVPQIWGDPTDPVVNYRPQPPKPGELVECCGTGMGFNLWRMSMFRDLMARKEMPKPLFRTKANMSEGTGTQDLVFWGEARKFGYRCAIDCSVLVGHWDDKQGIMW